jgi:hypothetical protein
LVSFLETFETPHTFWDKWAALPQDLNHPLHRVNRDDIRPGFAPASHYFHRQSFVFLHLL